MKKEFPILNYKSSSLIALPLMAATGLVYASSVATMPADETAKYGLGLIGISGMLSGLCMSFKANAQKYEESMDYAAEKFFLATILLVQIIFLSFVRDKIIGLSLIDNLQSAPDYIKAVFGIILIFIYGPACWSWYWAFDSVNKVLWSKWEDRIKDINKNT